MRIQGVGHAMPSTSRNLPARTSPGRAAEDRRRGAAPGWAFFGAQAAFPSRADGRRGLCRTCPRPDAGRLPRPRSSLRRLVHVHGRPVGRSGARPGDVSGARPALCDRAHRRRPRCHRWDRVPNVNRKFGCTTHRTRANRCRRFDDDPIHPPRARLSTTNLSVQRDPAASRSSPGGAGGGSIYLAACSPVEPNQTSRNP